MSPAGAPGPDRGSSGRPSPDLLVAGLRELGLDGLPGVRALRAYVSELERWGEKLGLVHARGDELVERHILDSLSALAAISPLVEGVASPVIADVGTGGGLPGVPLACFLPEVEFLLVERSGRKCGFLRGALPSCGIRNARVVQAQLSALRETATVVVFRALGRLTGPLLEQLLARVRPGGALCAYKGRLQRIREELAGLPAAGATQVIPLRVPGLAEERHLVIFRPTPA